MCTSTIKTISVHIKVKITIISRRPETNAEVNQFYTHVNYVLIKCNDKKITRKHADIIRKTCLILDEDKFNCI